MTSRKERCQFIYGIMMASAMFMLFVITNYYESLLRMYARFVIHQLERNSPVAGSFVLWLAATLAEEPWLLVEPRPSTVGLEQSVIASLPIFEYEKKTTLKCSICLSVFDDGDRVRILPNCEHTFHGECIDRWLESSTTCPVCRAHVAPQEPR
ncbi:hypothetical protein MLD38_030564 [Melastoma candidum]|uniref:Uncharacterized protein n=1 Tax=Melastoma candidum TaxID=119954 RepID=A0ACB9MQL8_9MYRT|nr:hypothetical protein MLD38_030564 [Melastoma candidum]